jgi:hypothetical protein
VWPLYASLFLGVTILTLWISLLAWGSSSGWAYAPSEKEFKPLLTREDALGERLRASVTKEAAFEK